MIKREYNSLFDMLKAMIDDFDLVKDISTLNQDKIDEMEEHIDELEEHIDSLEKQVKENERIIAMIGAEMAGLRK